MIHLCARLNQKGSKLFQLFETANKYCATSNIFWDVERWKFHGTTLIPFNGTRYLFISPQIQFCWTWVWCQIPQILYFLGDISEIRYFLGNSCAPYAVSSKGGDHLCRLYFKELGTRALQGRRNNHNDGMMMMMMMMIMIIWWCRWWRQWWWRWYSRFLRSWAIALIGTMTIDNQPDCNTCTARASQSFFRLVWDSPQIMWWLNPPICHFSFQLERLLRLKALASCRFLLERIITPHPSQDNQLVQR